MKSDRPRHAVHREVAQNIAALRADAFYAAALERNVGEFFHVKEFRAAQMIVPTPDARIDAANIDLRRHG